MQNLPYDESILRGNIENHFTLQRDYRLSKTLQGQRARIATSNVTFIPGRLIQNSDSAEDIKIEEVIHLPVITQNTEPKTLIGTCYSKHHWKKDLPVLFYTNGAVIEKYLYRHRYFVALTISYRSTSHCDNSYWDEILDCVLDGTPMVYQIGKEMVEVPLHKIDIELIKYDLSILEIENLLNREAQLLQQIDQLFAKTNRDASWEQRKKAIEGEFQKIDAIFLRLPRKINLGLGKVMQAGDASKSPHAQLIERLNVQLAAKQAEFKFFLTAIENKEYSRAVRILAATKTKKALASGDTQTGYAENMFAYECLVILLSFKEVLKINLDEQIAPENNAALHHAAQKRNPKTYQRLLAHRANPNLPNAAGITAAQLYATHMMVDSKSNVGVTTGSASATASGGAGSGNAPQSTGVAAVAAGAAPFTSDVKLETGSYPLSQLFKIAPTGADTDAKDLDWKSADHLATDTAAVQDTDVAGASATCGPA